MRGKYLVIEHNLLKIENTLLCTQKKSNAMSLFVCVSSCVYFIKEATKQTLKILVSLFYSKHAFSETRQASRHSDTFKKDVVYVVKNN